LFSGDLRKYGLTKAMKRQNEDWFTRMPYTRRLGKI
jgi:hypothetical protein